VDPVFAGALIDGGSGFRGFIAFGAGEYELPVLRQGAEGSHQRGLVLAALNGPYAEDDLFARKIRDFPRKNSVVNYPNSAGRNVEQRFHLRGRESRHRDDQVRCRGRFSGLSGKAVAKLPGAVVAGENEQVVKCRDLAPEAFAGQALVESVKKRRAAIAPGVGEESSADVGGFGLGAGAPEALGPVKPVPLCCRAGGCQAVQDLA